MLPLLQAMLLDPLIRVTIQEPPLFRVTMLELLVQLLEPLVAQLPMILVLPVEALPLILVPLLLQILELAQMMVEPPDLAQHQRPQPPQQPLIMQTLVTQDHRPQLRPTMVAQHLHLLLRRLSLRLTMAVPHHPQLQLRMVGLEQPLVLIPVK